MALNAVVLPQRLAAVAAEVIEQSLIVPSLFKRDGFDQFKGADTDTLYIRVPGVLPAREVNNGGAGDFRTERTAAITFDAYTERKISVKLTGNTYSATKLQDEQKDWDNIQWASVITTQAEAVARALEKKAINLIKPYNVTTNPTGTAYEATIAGAKTGGRTLRASLIELRRVANALRMPAERRTFVIGTAVEAAILNDATLTLAQNVGDAAALTALREATIGRLFGMDIVVAPELPADFGVLFVPSAFVMATAAPSVPQSATGGSASARGVAARWVLDYDPTILAERSVVNLYNGVRSVKDVLLNAAGTDVIQIGGTVQEYMIRAIAFDVDATADALPAAVSNNDRADLLFDLTGIGTGI